MRRFNRRWSDEIADISTLPEFQNAYVEILDPSVQGEYDIETGEWSFPDDQYLYQGRARVKDVRWGSFHGGESQFNVKTVTSIRVQVPKNSMKMPPKGAPVRVLKSADNPDLEGTVFLVSDGFQGGTQASRTFEAAVDSDAEVSSG